MMSRRVRTTKTSTSSSISPPKSKTKPAPTRKNTHNVVKKKLSVKKSSPTKRCREPISSTLMQTRQKRLSSLTAATLLQYCNSILSPTRKLNRSVKSTPTLSNNSKIQHSSKDNKNLPRKRQISNVSSQSEKKTIQIESHAPPTRSRREASSRASAMIMQQNEIERSRYNYSLNNKQTLLTIRRQPSKTIILPKDDPPPVPDSTPSVISIPIEIVRSASPNIVTNKSPLVSASTISKYPLLTEASLAEHNRLHETIPLYHSTKRDSLIKWTQELDLYDRLSPPYADHEISSETNNCNSINDKSTGSLITDSKVMNSITSHTSSHLSARNGITTPAFLFPPTAYPFDMHSYYSVLPCWQYSTWPFQSSLSIHPKSSIINSDNKTKQLAILNSKEKFLNSNSKQKIQDKSLTFHLHTHHHHHHIHNSSSSSTKLPISSEQDFETASILKLKDNNLLRNQSKHSSLTIEHDALNLSINNKLETNELIEKTTRRKLSSTKRRIHSETKSNSSPTPLVGSQDSSINYITESSSKKSINNNEEKIIISISNDQNLNGNIPIDKKNSLANISKLRSISAATTNSITTLSPTDRNLREKRTHSTSNISSRTKSLINRKRSYSPTSINLSLTNKNFHQRKKQKISNYWILSGKSEQRLVSIHTDKLPVFRECYSSIRHIIEKDIISSNDCIILRPETSTKNSSTPYSAKVKWFWKEPTTDEIQMSLMWYYHPEHTELSTRAKKKFLPNELLASRYSDCVSVACIEDKCYVLDLNEYNRYCTRENSSDLFKYSESVGQLKSLLNKNTTNIHHRSLPAENVDSQNIFFCRYVYDFRANRILKNPRSNDTNSNLNTITMSPSTASSI